MAESSDKKRVDGQNVPLEDIDAAAKAQGTTRAKVMQDDAGQSSRDVSHASQQGNVSAGQPANATQAQDGYDPTHSGVRHAQNRPGTRPPTPGRETGTSWGEDQQMGATTDTPDRENPAG